MVEEKFKMCSQLYAVLVLAFVNYSLVNGDRATAPKQCAKTLTTTTYDYIDMHPIDEIIEQNVIFLNFFVKASRDAHIILSPDKQPSKEDQKAYEIVIGSERNTVSRIRSKRLGTDVSKTQDENILSDKGYRQFWIRIGDDGLMEVGKGTEETPFMSWKDKSSFSQNVSHYGFASWKDGNTVNWAFPCSTNDPKPQQCERIVTTSTYDYKKMYPTEEIKNKHEIFLTFMVKASRDAHIIFAPDDQPAKQYDKAYEIVLGSVENTISGIRSTRRGHDEVRVTGQNIVTEKEWRRFWIRIRNGLIEVGKGLEYFPFMKWQDDSRMPINHYGLASWTDDNTVIWAFPCTKSRPALPKQCSRTSSTSSYDYTEMYPTGEIRDRKDIYIVFLVKAARDAHIIFAPDNRPAKQYDRAYEIVIGSVENTISVIRSTRRGHNEVRVTEQNILFDKEWRQFWIRINSQGLIEVGKGSESTPFMSWKDDSHMEINHYGFASWTDKNLVNWAFPCTENEPELNNCSYITTSQYDYRVAYPIAKKELDGVDIFLKFFIKANNNALVVLSPTSKPLKENEQAFEIMIGGDRDSNYDCTSIRLERHGTHPVDRKKICGTSKLSFNQWRPFWIRVSPHGLFQIGKKVGDNPFLVWKYNQDVEIKSFGLASFKNSVVHFAYDCQ